MTARVDTNTAVANAATLSQLAKTDINSANSTSDRHSQPGGAITNLAVTKEVIGNRACHHGNRSPSTSHSATTGPATAPASPSLTPLRPKLTYRPGDSGGTGPTTRSRTPGPSAPSQSGPVPPSIGPGTTATGTFTNAASLATVSPTNVNAANDSASASVNMHTPIADLAIVKGVSPEEAVVGDTVTYPVEVPNRGPDTVLDVFVTDPGPEGITVLDTAASQGTVNRRPLGTSARFPGPHPTPDRHRAAGHPGAKVDVVIVDAPLCWTPTRPTTSRPPPSPPSRRPST